MALFDAQGRLFGRVNLVDAAAVTAVTAAAVLTGLSLRAFRVPAPEIVSVVPATIPADGARQLRIQGRHFRPYLKALVGRTGEPFSLVDPQEPDSPRNMPTLVVDTPTSVELTLPALAPGTYDLYVYDKGREVARQTSAFTITAAFRPLAAVATERVDGTAVLEITARFDVDSDVARAVAPGDVDLNAPGGISAARRAAVILSTRRLSHVVERDLDLQVASGGRLMVVAAPPKTRLEVVARLGATQGVSAWEYAGQRIRPGERFAFSSDAYVINGIITRAIVLSEGRATDVHR